MSRSLLIAAAAAVGLLLVVWLAVRGGAGALQPEAPAQPSARAGAPRDAPAPLAGGGRTAATPEPEPSERDALAAAPAREIATPPRESLGLGSSADLAIRVANEALVPRVWTFVDPLVQEPTEEGGLVLALPLPAEAERKPDAASPWRVRAWGASAGEAPVELVDLRFDGTHEPEVALAAETLTAHGQVYLLLASWRGEPARYLAVCARAGFSVEPRVFACPEEATEPCRVDAWWGIGSDGSPAHSTIELDRERPLTVDARYASLFPVPPP